MSRPNIFDHDNIFPFTFTSFLHICRTPILKTTLVHFYWQIATHLLAVSVLNIINNYPVICFSDF
jgi:hypothetical protein